MVTVLVVVTVVVIIKVVMVVVQLNDTACEVNTQRYQQR